MSELPIAAMDRLIRKSTGLRVGSDAAEAMAEVLEERGAQVAIEAGKYAKHAQRKTVKSEHVRLAVKKQQITLQNIQIPSWAEVLSHNAGVAKSGQRR